MHHSQEATDTALDWCIELISQSNVLEVGAKYAILDECTSAVSMDVEGHLYSYMKQMGITLITVSHRETLWKYHDYLLKFYGDRQYSFGRMPEDKKVK